MAIMACAFVACTKTIYVPTRSSTTIVDTVVSQAADSAVIRALFECDSNNRVVLRALQEAHSQNASGSLDLDTSGRVEVVTRWRTQYIERIKEVRDTTTVVEVREVVKTVKHVPRFFWGCFAFSVLAVGAIVVKLLI